ncbi:MAG: flippase-like domain-containing protein [Bdellovibrionales bacterium]|nr:flippase-like domain-containing protein [Bdellovibrionales bacterium]
MHIIFRILITIFLLFAISQMVDFTVFGEVLRGFPTWAAATVVVGYSIGQVVGGMKWRILAHPAGVNFSRFRAISAYFVGMFFNLFGLGMVGGDLVRGVLVSGEGVSRTLGLSTVIADRIHGLVVLAFIGGLSAAVFRPEFLDSELIEILVFIGLGSTIAWIFMPWLTKRIFSSSSRLGQRLSSLARVFTLDSYSLSVATIYSTFLHLLQIGLHWVVISALGISIPFHYLLATVPFVNIIGSLPISWNGLGVREACYIFFFSSQRHFMSEEQAVAVGLVWLFGMTISAMFGGAFIAFSKDMSFARLTKRRYPIES